MAATKFQVFVSSTYQDLVQEREQVIKAVLEMGHIPVGMEMFSAGDEQQWKIIQSHIDESDYYICVVAHRYGSMHEGVSYTRKEYEYAVSRGIPILGFLIDPEAAWPANQVETSAIALDALQEFKSRMMEKPVGFWSSAKELYGMCSISLMKAITANPREGWVRAATIAGPQVTAELGRLSAENARLREEIARVQSKSESEREESLLKMVRDMKAIRRKLSYRYARSRVWEDDADDKSLYGYFILIAPEILVEYEVENVAKYLAMHVRKDESRNADIVPVNHVRSLLADFVALDLVMPSVRRHSVADQGEYWTLTERGKELLNMHRRGKLLTEASPKEPSGAGDTPANQPAEPATSGYGVPTELT